MLELTGVTAGYGRHQVLADLDLSLREPGPYLVLGGNGCGKSTLLRVASGRLRPRKGQVRLDGVQLYRLFGGDMPFHEFVGFNAIPQTDATLLEVFRLKLEAARGAVRLGDLLRDYDVPWKAEQFASLRQTTLSTSEMSELHLLLALATAPRFLFVDELFSQCGGEVTGRMTGNLQRWSSSTGGLALVASTRFAGYMDVFRECFVLSGGKLRPLPGSGRKAEASVASAADAATELFAPAPGDVTFVFGEFFYRHQRVAQDNPHFTLKAVLENALLVNLKGTLDGALGYLRELGLDPVRIEFAEFPSQEDREEAGEGSPTSAS